MVWLLAGVYFLLKPARYLFIFWSPYYINARLGADTAESGILGSLFDLAGPLGMLLGGFLSDRLFHARRIPVVVLASLGGALLLFAFSHLPASRLAIGLGLFGIGFLLYIPDSLVSGTAAIDFGTKKGAATATGIINGCGSAGAVIGGTLPGWVEGIVGTGDVWGPIFNGLGIGLL